MPQNQEYAKLREAILKRGVAAGSDIARRTSELNSRFVVALDALEKSAEEHDNPKIAVETLQILEDSFVNIYEEMNLESRKVFDREITATDPDERIEQITQKITEIEQIANERNRNIETYIKQAQGSLEQLQSQQQQEVFSKSELNEIDETINDLEEFVTKEEPNMLQEVKIESPAAAKEESQEIRATNPKLPLLSYQGIVDAQKYMKEHLRNDDIDDFINTYNEARAVARDEKDSFNKELLDDMQEFFVSSYNDAREKSAAVANQEMDPREKSEKSLAIIAQRNQHIRSYTEELKNYLQENQDKVSKLQTGNLMSDKTSKLFKESGKNLSEFAQSHPQNYSDIATKLYNKVDDLQNKSQEKITDIEKEFAEKIKGKNLHDRNEIRNTYQKKIDQVKKSLDENVTNAISSATRPALIEQHLRVVINDGKKGNNAQENINDLANLAYGIGLYLNPEAAALIAVDAIKQAKTHEAQERGVKFLQSLVESNTHDQYDFSDSVGEVLAISEIKNSQLGKDLQIAHQENNKQSMSRIVDIMDNSDSSDLLSGERQADFNNYLKNVATGNLSNVQQRQDVIENVELSLAQMMARDMLAITADEMLIYTADQNSPQAENARTAVGNFNNLTYMVSEDILSQKSLAEQQRVYEFYVDVAHEAVEKGHTGVVMAIAASFGSSSVSRLPLEERLSQERAEKLLLIKQATDPAKSYKNIRENSNVAGGVPYLGVISSDLTFAKEGNEYIPTRVELMGKVNKNFTEKKRDIAGSDLTFVKPMVNMAKRSKDMAEKRNMENFDADMYKISKDAWPAADVGSNKVDMNALARTLNILEENGMTLRIRDGNKVLTGEDAQEAILGAVKQQLQQDKPPKIEDTMRALNTVKRMGTKEGLSPEVSAIKQRAIDAHMDSYKQHLEQGDEKGAYNILIELQQYLYGQESVDQKDEMKTRSKAPTMEGVKYGASHGTYMMTLARADKLIKKEMDAGNLPKMEKAVPTRARAATMEAEFLGTKRKGKDKDSGDSKPRSGSIQQSWHDFRKYLDEHFGHKEKLQPEKIKKHDENVSEVSSKAKALVEKIKRRFT